MSHQHKTLSVTVRRDTGNGSQDQTFEVPEQDSQTVLDVVTYIQEYLDPTLSYRFACRVGMCGSCGMMVNGEPRWTCRTHVKKVTGASKSLTIAPLRNLPVIKDLVVDMDPFFDKWVRAGGVHHPTATRHEPIQKIDEAGADRQEANEAIECINCGVCYAACDVVGANPDYFGPAALNRAWSLVNDVKTSHEGQIFDAVNSHAGCHNCHAQQGCARYCPNELNPSASIAGLKRKAAGHALKKLLRGGK
ncbi:succinate dehydrogenase and fumarate reductase iron-sulfur protein [SAR116 cluster alpha proteobacterium HIMB100]|nr:succinate dehydrogenase and fumarate reductase iron-sulfur protein [SAR116 cluster alpha proteobacterium HIMB100]